MYKKVVSGNIIQISTSFFSANLTKPLPFSLSKANPTGVRQPGVYAGQDYIINF